MQDHIDELDKKELKSTGWTTTPLNNVDHDFVTNLIARYIDDVKTKMALYSSEKASFCQNLRKNIKIGDVEELVDSEFKKIAYLKEQADIKERELEKARIRAEHNKKVKKLINDKVDFKKVKVFKRQNSYEPQNEEFGDIDDVDAIKANFNRIRRSLDPTKKRGVLI